MWLTTLFHSLLSFEVQSNRVLKSLLLSSNQLLFYLFKIYMGRNDNNDETERFEDLLLDWMRTVTIFFIAGIALYHFTKFGKPYAIVAFSLSFILVITMIVDYILRRNELTAKGNVVRLPLDIMVAVMMVGAGLILWIIWEVIIEPYPDNPAVDDEVVDVSD